MGEGQPVVVPLRIKLEISPEVLKGLFIRSRLEGWEGVLEGP